VVRIRLRYLTWKLRVLCWVLAAAGRVRVEYKKPLTRPHNALRAASQGQKSQSLEWEETKPE
jgi:hypothetical protein